MNFIEKFKELLKDKDMKIADLSRATNIPASTIYNAINRDFTKMDIKHLSKISEALDVSMDYLVKDEITDKNYGKTIDFTITLPEQNHIKKYRVLDERGKEFVDTVLDRECERISCTEQKQNGKEVNYSQFRLRENKERILLQETIDS